MLFYDYLTVHLTLLFPLQAVLTTARRHHVRSIWLLPHAHPPVAGLVAHGRRGAQLPPRFRDSLWRNAGRGSRGETIQGKSDLFWQHTKKERKKKRSEVIYIWDPLVHISARIDDIKMNKINAMAIHFTNGTRALCNSIPCDLHVTGSVSRKAFLSVRNNVPCNTRNN